MWDENVSTSEISTIHDPFTGNEIHKLRYAGIEVSSRLGYERVSPTREDKLITYITTVMNNTDVEASVSYGGAEVDDHLMLPLWIVPSSKNIKKHDRKSAWGLDNMHCFKTGFAPHEMLFSAQKSPQVITVRPHTSVTISFVTKDPRSTALLCSIGGCHMTGAIRYYVTVSHRDFVFVWPGRSVVYCGG